MGSAASAATFSLDVNAASAEELAKFIEPISPGGRAKLIRCIKSVENENGDPFVRQLSPFSPSPRKGSRAKETSPAKGGLDAARSRLRQPLHCKTNCVEEFMCKSKLLPVEESRALVAAPAPADKPIVGTDVSEFEKVTPQLDSGISNALDQCFNDLSTDIFCLPFSVSIAIPTIEDTPLIGISDGFLTLSGYSREEIVGRNCRLLLQGVPEAEVLPKVRSDARQYCRAAHLRNVTSMAHSLLLQRNARKNGELFWNLFMLAVVPGPEKKRTYIVGLQLDLGAELPPEHKSCPEAAMEAHREHLAHVHSMMFGKRIPAPLPPPDSPTNRRSKSKQAFTGLSTDIKSWLAHAESQSAQFQEWGTLPWMASADANAKHALLNGGVTLLRLHADCLATGARAMSIFPMDKRRAGQRTLKVTIDEVCPHWGTKVSEGAHLPTLGFTQSAPAHVDSLGGLPDDIQNLPDTICMQGDGQLFKTSDGETKLVTVATKENNHEIRAGDAVELIWNKNTIRVEISGEVVYSAEDPSIGAPPKANIFGVVDCCYAACRMTLMA